MNSIVKVPFICILISSNLLQIAVENKLDIPENYTIINTLGQIIKAKKIDSEADLSINVSN
jgi:energy-converting hydrogenase Eha subunit C